MSVPGGVFLWAHAIASFSECPHRSTCFSSSLCAALESAARVWLVAGAHNLFAKLRGRLVHQRTVRVSGLLCVDHVQLRSELQHTAPGLLANPTLVHVLPQCSR